MSQDTLARGRIETRQVLETLEATLGSFVELRVTRALEPGAGHAGDDLAP
jgi:hypothetical protein